MACLGLASVAVLNNWRQSSHVSSISLCNRPGSPRALRLPSSSRLNDYRPVALTSIVMKVSAKLVLQVLQLVTDSQFDPLQFAYRVNRSVDDAVSLTLHRVLEHLETAGSYARILFIDYSSAFNTVVPQKLFDKLVTMKVDLQLCRWVLDFLLNRSQVVRIIGRLSGKLTLNTGTPQGCDLSPLLSHYSPMTVVRRAIL